MRYALVNNNSVVRTTVEGQEDFILLDGSIIKLTSNDNIDLELKSKGYVEYEEIEKDSLRFYNNKPFRLYRKDLEFVITDTKVTGTVVLKPLDLEEARSLKRMEIKSLLSETLGNNKFSSNVLGIIVDCRTQYGTSDITNVDNLILLVEQGLVTLPFEFKGSTNSATISDVNTLKQLRVEMADNIYQLYQTKFEKNRNIDTATSVEELERI